VTKEQQEIFRQATEINRLKREYKDLASAYLKLKQKLFDIVDYTGLSEKYLTEQGIYRPDNYLL
jgi:archaellum component FlaC